MPNANYHTVCRSLSIEAVEAFRSLRSEGPPHGDPSGPARLRKALENPGTPDRGPSSAFFFWKWFTLNDTRAQGPTHLATKLPYTRRTPCQPPAVPRGTAHLHGSPTRPGVGQRCHTRSHSRESGTVAYRSACDHARPEHRWAVRSHHTSHSAGAVQTVWGCQKGAGHTI